MNFDTFLESNTYVSMEYKKLNKPGKEYLDFLLKNCPSQDEGEFNIWSSSGRVMKPLKKQAVLAECIYIMFLNGRKK